MNRLPRQAQIGTGILILLILGAVAGQWLWPGDPFHVASDQVLKRPCWAFPCGTDALGRDVLARVLAGARTSLLTGFWAALFGSILGSGLGIIAALRRGWVDALFSRLADTFHALPPLVGALALIGLSGARRPAWPPFLVSGTLIGLFAWPVLFRFVRAEGARLVQSDVVLSAMAAGAGRGRIALRHLLPLAMFPALAPMTFLAAGALLVDAALGFVGLGVPPPEPSWGGLLMDAVPYLAEAWWLTVFPALGLFLAALGLFLIGNAMVPRGRTDGR